MPQIIAGVIFLVFVFGMFCGHLYDLRQGDRGAIKPLALYVGLTILGIYCLIRVLAK